MCCLTARSKAAARSFLSSTARSDWDGTLVEDPETFVTAIGAGTTYPDYKPAPFIVSSQVRGVDTVTVVTEGIFSYCGVKVKIDTDRHLGPECAPVRVEGEEIGHVTTAEYGSQMLSLGGVRHLTGGSKKEGRVTCEALLALCNRKPVELHVDGGASAIIQAGKAPIVNGLREERMRVGCGSATIGMFAKQWIDHVDEVVVVDDHITGVLSEHQAGKFLGVRETGVRINGHRSTPGRYFKVAQPGTGWGGTDLYRSAENFEGVRSEESVARHAPAYGLDHRRALRLFRTRRTPDANRERSCRPRCGFRSNASRKTASRRFRRCCSWRARAVRFARASPKIRSGLTRSVRDAVTRVTAGGAPCYIWPGGGITLMVDVSLLPENAFGSVPTPALVGPIEFTMTKSDYAALGGHMDQVRSLADVAGGLGKQRLAAS